MDWAFRDTDHVQIGVPVCTVSPRILVLIMEYWTTSGPWQRDITLLLFVQAFQLCIRHLTCRPCLVWKTKIQIHFVSRFVSNMLIFVLPSSQHRCMLPQTANLRLLARTLIPVCGAAHWADSSKTNSKRCTFAITEQNLLDALSKERPREKARETLP